VVEAGLVLLKRCREIENRLAILDGNDTTRGERISVPNSIHIVDDGLRRVTPQQEEGV
jgi:hypothetical protein